MNMICVQWSCLLVNNQGIVGRHCFFGLIEVEAEGSVAAADGRIKPTSVVVRCVASAIYDGGVVDEGETGGFDHATLVVDFEVRDLDVMRNGQGKGTENRRDGHGGKQHGGD